MRVESMVLSRSPKVAQVSESNARSADAVSLADLFATLTATDYERHRPFRWQQRLLDRLLQGDVPDAVDVPTGLGKTAVMALWLIALGKGATLPRRLVYVVDRRAVVDQASRFAERLRQNLPADLARDLGVADRGGGLPISTLRGGFADNRAWQEDPSIPAIVVGTVDMIGSRLLFQGYGVSRGMRPYLAGLLGADALVLLDEAHLCPPFEALLRRISKHREAELGPVVDSGTTTPPFRLMSLSATGRDSAALGGLSVFKLGDEDRSEGVVYDRLNAEKRLRVERLEDPSTLAESLAHRAIEIGASGAGQHPRIIVYCHSRSVAVDVKGRIDKEWQQRRSGANDGSPGWVSELLVGERRVHERTELEGWLERQGFLGGSSAEHTGPAVLVATSAGEVGVDLDADHLVCDLVPYERMVQRLGRVNRRGGQGRSARVDVFASLRPRSVGSGSKAERARRAADDLKRWLEPLALLRRVPEATERHDASPASIVEMKAQHPKVVQHATTPPPLYPELTRPLLDAWAMTSLDQHEGRPEVTPWLRGWEETEPQTEVVWRTHLPAIQADDDVTLPAARVAAYFRSAPIHVTEKLEAGTDRVLMWLLRRAARLVKREVPLFTSRDQAHEIVCILLDRSCRRHGILRVAELRKLAAPTRSLAASDQKERDAIKRKWKDSLLPSALLVVDARLGGLRDGMLDESVDKEAVTADADSDWQQLKQGPAADAPPVIGFRVQEVGQADDGESLTEPAQSDKWHHFRTFETRLDSGGRPVDGLAVLKWAHEPLNEDARSVGSSLQVLAEHTEAVVERVRRITLRLDLRSSESFALESAALLHDEGKSAPRWQRAMNAPEDGRVYAKIGKGGSWRALEGYRHEFGSLVEAETLDLPAETRDLVLHLIASHHGYARPVIPFNGCDVGPPSLLEAKAGDAALRFAKLQRLYGPWGLAWREAILRSADQSASQLAGLKGGAGSG